MEMVDREVVKLCGLSWVFVGSGMPFYRDFLTFLVALENLPYSWGLMGGHSIGG